MIMRRRNIQWDVASEEANPSHFDRSIRHKRRWLNYTKDRYFYTFDVYEHKMYIISIYQLGVNKLKNFQRLCEHTYKLFHERIALYASPQNKTNILYMIDCVDDFYKRYDDDDFDVTGLYLYSDDIYINQRHLRRLNDKTWQHEFVHYLYSPFADRLPLWWHHTMKWWNGGLYHAHMS